MSENENWTGTLREIDIGVSIELYLRNHYEFEGIEIPKHCDSYTELATCERSDFLIHNNKLYRYENLHDANSNIASRNADGSVDFAVGYYNGGCSMEEAIEGVLDILIKKEEG